MMDDIWSKLDAGAYSNREPYPARPRKPHVDPQANPTEILAYADKLETYEQEMYEFFERVAHYSGCTLSLEAEFRHDLEKYHGMAGHPKADLLYGKSCQVADGAGYHEVASVYEDLVDLVL